MDRKLEGVSGIFFWVRISCPLQKEDGGLDS